jgi:hypothetical protein
MPADGVKIAPGEVSQLGDGEGTPKVEDNLENEKGAAVFPEVRVEIGHKYLFQGGEGFLITQGKT